MVPLRATCLVDSSSTRDGLLRRGKVLAVHNVHVCERLRVCVHEKKHCICTEIAAMYECLCVCCISLYMYMYICMCSLYSN